MAALAASLIVGNVVTATPVSSGIRANFRVASVTKPSVPSEPVKRPFRLYPAEDFLDSNQTIMMPAKDRINLPWPLSSFDHSPIREDDC